MRSSKTRLSSERGFALVTAIMACAILFALAMLIINLSTGDLQVSVRNVGEKKAMIAVEAGIHQLVRNFNDQNPAASAVTNVSVDATNDPASVYTITVPTRDATGLHGSSNPILGSIPGYGPEWGMERFDVISITGRNTNYNSTVTVDIDIGYGPIGPIGPTN